MVGIKAFLAKAGTIDKAHRKNSQKSKPLHTHEKLKTASRTIRMILMLEFIIYSFLIREKTRIFAETNLIIR